MRNACFSTGVNAGGVEIIHRVPWFAVVQRSSAVVQRSYSVETKKQQQTTTYNNNQQASCIDYYCTQEIYPWGGVLRAKRQNNIRTSTRNTRAPVWTPLDCCFDRNKKKKKEKKWKDEPHTPHGKKNLCVRKQNKIDAKRRVKGGAGSNTW